jgi:putative salt-induced outer membrane protein YdiY
MTTNINPSRKSVSNLKSGAGLVTLALGGCLLASATPVNAQVAPPPEPPKWETSAAAGFTLTDGNSDSILFTGDIRTERKWSQDELRLRAEGAYGENEDVKNNELARGTAQWDHLFTERFYGFLRFEALHDAIADVEYRLTLTAGPGYYFIKNDRMLLSAEAGPGFIQEKLGSGEDSYMTLRAAERFQYKISDHARVFQSLEYLPQVDDFDNYLLNFEAGVEADITKQVALRVTFQDTYDNQPAEGRERNDIKLISSIVWKFF